VLEQLSYSPGLDAMVGICGRQVEGPIQVRVLKDGKPVAGQTVDFLIVGSVVIGTKQELRSSLMF
jgi:hypothetical protein